jgi:hypothetical protein
LLEVPDITIAQLVLKLLLIMGLDLPDFNISAQNGAIIVIIIGGIINRVS